MRAGAVEHGCVCGQGFAPGGSWGSILYRGGEGDFSVVLAPEQRPMGSDPFSSVSMDWPFLAEGTVRVKGAGVCLPLLREKHWGQGGRNGRGEGKDARRGS